jgi:hypothetical protein
MKLEFRTFIALSIMTVSAAALPVAAAENDSLRVTVPFVFTAGNATLPAGDYVISQQLDSHILTIGGKGGGAILVAIPQEQSGELRASTLTFERTSKGNTLTEIQMYGKPSVIMTHAAVAGK